MVPIILLTVDNMEVDIVIGLEAGANDYITKPFSLMVLRARVLYSLGIKRCQRRIPEISLLRKKMLVLPTVYAENRKEPYGIKSYIFLCINNQKGHLFMYNYVTNKTYERRCP